MKVSIVDVGIGNRNSIRNWLRGADIEYCFLSTPREYEGGLLILPGVTSAGIYMEALQQTGFDKLIFDAALENELILGICAGFQILTDFSEENGGIECLGVIPGKTSPMNELGLGHEFNNGWSNVSIDSRLFGEKLRSNSDHGKPGNRRKKIVNGRVYFNHRYGVKLQDSREYVSATIGETGAAAFAIRENIFGLQFHPEKSQLAGIELLDIIL